MFFSYKRRRELSSTLGFNSSLPIRDIVKGWNDRINVSLAGSVTKTKSNIKKFNSTRGELTLNFSYSFGGK